MFGLLKKMSNESMLPNKLDKHFKSKHSHLQGKPTSFLRECQNNKQKQQILLRVL